MCTDASDYLNLRGKELSSGRFQVGEQFAQTRSTCLYHALDRQTDTTVVVKVPRPDRLRNPHFARRFVREAAALIPLSHPHLVSVFAADEQAGLPFAVVADMTGRNLWERGIHWHEVRSWLPEVAAALDYLTGQGFVHRCLGPGEILFAADGRVAVSEAGIVPAMPGEPTNAFRLADMLYQLLDQCRRAAGPAVCSSASLWDVLRPELTTCASLRAASCAELEACIAAA
jgi:serine/threonine protein kinase